MHSFLKVLPIEYKKIHFIFIPLDCPLITYEYGETST